MAHKLIGATWKITVYHTMLDNASSESTQNSLHQKYLLFFFTSFVWKFTPSINASIFYHFVNIVQQSALFPWVNIFRNSPCETGIILSVPIFHVSNRIWVENNMKFLSQAINTNFNFWFYQFTQKVGLSHPIHWDRSFG